MSHTLLFALISHHLGHTVDWGEPKAKDWADTYNLARRHALCGVLFPSFDACPCRDTAPLGLYSTWSIFSQKVQDAYYKRVSQCQELQKVFADAAMPSCIIKGIASAALYPKPELRQNGDIDIWVDASRKELLHFLSSRFQVGEVVYHHCDCEILQGCEIEVHFTPSWMNDPILNKRLQRYFRSKVSAQCAHYDDTTACIIADRELCTVLGIVHIWRHLVSEGVTLRQIMDLYYALVGYEDSKSLESLMDSLGLLKVTASLMYVLDRVFALPRQYHITQMDPVKGQLLLDEILNYGGKYKKKEGHEGYSLTQFIKRSRQSMKFFSICPRDILCSFPFKACQFVWRVKNNYI